MVVNFVLTAVMKIGEYLVAPVGRHFGYLIFYDRNIKNLEKQAQKLEDKRFGVQKLVKEAEAKRETIAPDVERWLTTVNKLNEEAKKFLEDEVKANKGCLNGRCPNLKSQYSLSRKATKKTQSVEELLRERGDFSRVAYPTPRAGISFISIGGYKAFESRSSIMNNVMEALADDGIYMIGICGMGGVGKTTLVKEVAKKAQEKKMFDKIVMVVVSQNPDLISIQGQIAKLLDFELFGENNLLARAEDLRRGIWRNGKVLTILDDVWKRLDLNEMGIPCGDNHKGCKIVMTSRGEDVCNRMDTQKNFMVSVLHEEEGWNLFKEMAEISNDGTSHQTDLQLTQMAVAKECGGLPIAIVTVGRALRCKIKCSWDSALEQLRKAMGNNISEVDEKVFKSLELSYDSLESDKAKKCFLLCSLYPEDFDIPIEDLVRYAIGIELFERIDSVHQARNRVHSLVDDLKKCYLLMESKNEECIKMHDVVRDVAISIASREEHSIIVRCDEVLKEWPKKDQFEKKAIISLKVDGMHGLPGNLEFPNLHLLNLDCNAGLHPIPSCYLSKGMEESQDSFYQGMKELKVLALFDMYGSLTTSLRCLTNLRTLSLSRCRLIDDGISVIGALENLEILRFDSSYIKELPKEIIGHLTHLKVLDLLGCVVERIYPGVLSSLSKLEELYVGSIFKSWCKDEKRKEGAKAIIDELASLSNLVALDIDLINMSFWPRGLVVEKLKKFNISVGSRAHCYISFGCSSLSNQLKLGVENMIDIIKTRLNFLLKRTKILTLNARVKGLKIFCDDEDGFECLTNLSLCMLYDLAYLINTADGVPRSAFLVLEFLKLSHLRNFKGITSHECRLPNKAFSALKSVEVHFCGKLESMFPLSIARNLVQLQDLQIHGCGVMEEIVSSKGVEHEIAAIAIDKIEFPKLKKLCLQYLPSFIGICKAMNAIQLPQLSSLSLSNMPKLKRLCPASDSESNCDPIIQPLFNDKDKLATIEELTICGMENLMEIWPGELEAKLRKMTVKLCHGLSNILFPSNSIPGMQNLEVLEVEDCRSIGVAFDLEGLGALPSLKKVELSHLRKLTHVWKGNLPGIQDFQNLRSLMVNDCDSLRNLISYSLAKLLVKLQKIEVTECGMMESIIGNEPNADDAVITNRIMFPQLSSLKLSDLPNLSSFCSEACTFEGSLLKTIEVINCPKMKILPSAFQRKLEQPQKADFSTLYQRNLLDGKFIFRRDYITVSEDVTITDINGSIEMWHNQLEVDRLGRVRFMLVQFCGKLSSVISSNLMQRLRNLERLKVWWCDSLETIFDLQGSVCAGTTGGDATMIIGLENLKLMYLPKLTHIWKNVSQQTHRFRHLTSLEVERCDNLRYLFTISTVKILVRLNYLRIGNCTKVEKIVTREEEEDDHDDIDDDDSNFSVELENLPSLVCIGIPESKIRISKLCVDFCPKYRGYDVEGE